MKPLRTQLVDSDVARVLALFARHGGRRLALGAFLATVVVLAGIALLGTSGWFITATALAGAGALFNVFVPSAAIRLLALGRTFGRYAERLVTHDATLAVLAALRERLFRGWAGPDAARALLRRPSRLLFRLTSDIDALESVYLRLLVPALAAGGAALLAGLVLGAIDWRLGAAVCAWLVVAGTGTAVVVARRARPAALRRARALERLRAGAIDLVAGQADLAMAGRLPAQCDQLYYRDLQLARADDALHRLETRAGWTYAAAGHVTVAGVLLAAGALARHGAVGAPGAALALLVALAALEPFAALRRGAIEAGRSWLAARRIAPRLRAQGVPCAQQLSAGAASGDALTLQDVTVQHSGRECAALRDASLRIAAGERVAVVGASGAGKSTLLALAAGELAPQSGTVRALPCTWLTQRTELFQDTLRDNLLLAAPQAGDERLWEALRAAGLEQDVRRFARGLDTPLGEGGLGLSGGQSRRLALARLLLRDAAFWLLDEPTEALDGATAADVLARLARHAAGRTVLVATHLRREAALADRLLVMRGGRLVADVRRGTNEFDAALSALRPD
ncbi:thiol reductant ABC exporter subunit CydC [Pseudoduganella umbonata]|uniref:ATP-binding cassette subfamily C protein CydC n=1 Tax=Pseudoduganella umbonata TaxID=864828 RepID=A0A4P8HLV8_9BURK|nr:thiol reductant ABC exporter subunit CydC [Pseudoduganella umbonata]MBB3225157.1 ATP-binding cassette subfamily C protein CydC [Pseudoduganella umbonata]QCP09312.1 thiol reductant ABC exporter subunit CydC [Pseudoduganella umbonata]